MSPYRRSKTNPNAPYYVQVTHPGGRREQYNTRKTDRQEAITEGMRYAAEIRLGVHLRPDPVGTLCTLQEIVDRYIDQAVHVSDATKTANVRRLIQVLKASDKSLSASPDVLTRSLAAKYQNSVMRSNVNGSVTANSTLRQARSIFSRRCMSLYDDLKLPDLSGFMKHQLLKEPQMQYRLPQGNAIEIVCNDAKSLKDVDPGAYAAFLLEMYCGLRANEVCRATWDWVGNDGGCTYLEVPWAMHHKSGGKVPVHESVITELKTISDGGEHIVPAASDNARRTTVYRRLSKWLHGHGLNRGKTNHELRKFLGSKIATEQGLYAAQKVLRHSSPSLTSRCYADWVGLPEPVSLQVQLA